MGNVDYYSVSSSWASFKAFKRIFVRHIPSTRSATWLDFGYRVTKTRANVIVICTQGPPKTMLVVLSSR